MRARKPYQRHSDTSEEAAKSVDPAADTWLSKVYRELIKAGPVGRTDDELQIILDMNPSTQRPRRIDLVKRSLVCDSGARRKTRSNRPAVVWVLPKYAQRQLELL
jgi:hypothetical protein